MTGERTDNYNGNPNIKRDGVVQEFTQTQMLEYAKCSHDPVYFCRNYIKVIHLDKGLIPFDLYPYQEEMFNHFNDNRFSVVLACRQSGKSQSACAYLLWYAIFHPEKTVAVLANKGDTAQEMVTRITLMVENLPFFLQPGCKALNKRSIEFSNNSRILAAATSGSSIRGKSINLLYLDEFAFVDDATTFYTSTYPVITSGLSSKVIITSTANGIGNMFHQIWENAVRGKNEYSPFRVDWWDVPGRDEKWKEQTIANTSELQFEQEFSNSFIGTGSTLISPTALLELHSEEPLVAKEGQKIKLYREPVHEHQYVMTVDVAKGRGQDFSTFNIIDVTEKPFTQVATFRDSLISPMLFPSMIYKYASLYNNAYVIVESNDQGNMVASILYHEFEYEDMFIESATKNALGMTMSKRTKRIGCSNLKDIVESHQLKIVDAETIHEASTFEVKGSSYAASSGNHDDLIINLVMFAWFTTTDLFAQQTDIDMRKLMYMDAINEVEKDVVPVGVLGIEDSEDIPFDENDGMDARTGWHVVRDHNPMDEDHGWYPVSDDEFNVMW